MSNEKFVNSYDDIFEKYVQDMDAEVEKKYGRRMNNDEITGVRSCGTLMFLESASMGLYCAKTQADVEKWLAEMATFRRT